MMELPEARVIAVQAEKALMGKLIVSVTANHTPHKFAWFTSDPQTYAAKLTGKTMGPASSAGCHVAMRAGDMNLVFGTNLRYHGPGEALPKKHQQLLVFDDGSALSASVQMWGVILCYADGEGSGALMDYGVALGMPSPLDVGYGEDDFMRLFDGVDDRLSAKALLATEQRIPGVGNGVTQDILFRAGIHPKRKVATMSAQEHTALYLSLRETLAEMVAKGGRDTEKDLYGRPGGYATLLSRNTAGKPCPVCGTPIAKEAYLGGSVYYCGTCQPLP